MTKPTWNEARILKQAEKIKARLQWLDDHPGKTRTDYRSSLPKRIRPLGAIPGAQNANAAARAISKVFARKPEGAFSEEEIKELVRWALPRKEEKAVALIHQILTENYFRDPSSGKFTLPKETNAA